MPTLPSIILQNVLRNVSDGLTFGQVEIINMTTDKPETSAASLEQTPLLSLLTTKSLPATSDIISDAINHTITNATNIAKYNQDDLTSQVTTESSLVCLNRTLVPNPTEIGDIPAKEIIIVIMMLSLWIYSIVETWKFWNKILK